MGSPERAFSRPSKEDDAQTVLYEIDMLRFTRERLLSSKDFGDRREQWVYLESFLLHYRNLIEFFGKPNVGRGDLSIRQSNTIPLRGAPDVSSMVRLDLWEKYDTRDNDEAISKYLHHCTTQRTNAKEWMIMTVYEDLRPTIEGFESLLPEYRPTPSLTAEKVVGEPTVDSMSTASTRTIDLGLNSNS